MGKFDELLKLISTNIEKHGDDAAKILDEVSSPELAVALKGKPREKYLKALDVVQGPKDVRAKDMGFGDKTWYHGTTVPIEQFERDALGASTNAQSAKQGFFFASDPSTASDYAELAKERGVSRESIREGSLYRQISDFEDKMQVKYGPGYESKMSNDDYQKLTDLQARYENAQLGNTNSPQDLAAKKLKELYLDKQVSPSGITIGAINFKSPNEIDEHILKWEKRILENPEDKDFINRRIEQLKKGKDKLQADSLKLQDVDSEITRLEDQVNSVGQNVMPVRLKGNKDSIRVKDYKGEPYRDSTYADEMRWAQAEGKEGVLFRNTYDPADPNNRVRQNIAVVFEPEQVRSVNAAFDKRFAKSPLLLAGAGAVPMTDNFKNPLDYIKDAASAYETTKNKILKPVANQMDLTKDKSAADDIQSILSAVVDPVNLVNGPVGLGLGAAQMLGTDQEKEAKQRALNKLMGK